jgi:hypothetical protein
MLVDGGGDSYTRFSAIRRDLSGVELTEEGFEAVDNVGNQCHGIGFWKQQGNDEDGQNAIKFISLDSKSGSLVSIVLSGPGAEEREREVLWMPDLSHPALQLPDDMQDGYKSRVFSKGLAVQGGVAYFGVSGARRAAGRGSVNPTLLVAVDLETREELFVRVVQSHGIINQVVSESHLAYHFYQPAEELSSKHEQLALTIAEVVEDEFPNLDALDFSQSDDEDGKCYDNEGATRRLPLSAKYQDVVTELKLERDQDKIVQKLCMLDVSAVRDKLTATWHDTFDKDLQNRTNARIDNRSQNMERVKPGVSDALFIFSDRQGDDIFHLPWLDEWLPVLEEAVLKPLRIDLNTIIRMQFARMSSGATIYKHTDRGMWVRYSHRIHVPLFTNNGIYFIAESPRGFHLRIPSKVGAAYEFNNAVPHAVRNYGDDRVHLILDWAEEPAAFITKLEPGQVCSHMGDAGIFCGEEVYEEAYEEDTDYAANENACVEAK